MVAITMGLLFFLSFNACIDSEKAAEKMTEKIIKNSTGEDVDIEIDGEGEDAKVTIKGKDGEELSFSGGENKLPKDLPNDVYVIDGKITGSGTMSSGEGSMITFSVETEKDFDDVKSKILKEFEKEGWTTVSDMTVGKNGMLSFSKEKHTANITINGEKKIVEVAYIIGLSKE